jgi:hypothetical protein
VLHCYVQLSVLHRGGEECSNYSVEIYASTVSTAGLPSPAGPSEKNGRSLTYSLDATARAPTA